MIYPEDHKEFRGLDIGCGIRPKKGWLGFDVNDSPSGVIKHDMTTDQLPFRNSTADAIRCVNTLEHVERKYYNHIFNEWYRVLKPEAEVEIIVPNFLKNAAHALNDITHVSLWVPGMVQYLTGERPRYADYGFLPWEKVIVEDLPKEPRDMRIILRTRIKKRTGKKYGE